jgi:phage terminase large subunit-like protein
VRGRIHLSQRPDFLVLDDFETNKTKESQAYIKQVREHISEAMTGMSTDGSIVYLGNYITEYGNVQFLFDRAKIDHKLRIRNVPVVIGGKPAWPDKYCLTDAEAKITGKVSIEDKKRQLGSLVFSYEMMNQPIDETLCEFKKEFETYITMAEVEKMSTRRFITIDTAVSEATSADFTGVTINYVNGEKKWHLQSFKVKYNPKELMDYMFTMWRNISPECIGIERTIYLQAVKPFLDDEMRRRGIFMTIVELQHNQTAKETRIRGLIPRWESKSIVFIQDQCVDLQEEMRTCPRGIHDDVLDSLAYQMQVAQTPAPQGSYQSEGIKPFFSEFGL